MKYLWNILLIALVCAGVVYIRRVSPTDMGGLGMDIVVFIAAVVIGVVLVAKSIMRVDNADKRTYIGLAINAIGLLVICLLIYYVGTRKV